MRWRGGVLKPPDQERKKLLQRPASLEMHRVKQAQKSTARRVPPLLSGTGFDVHL
jgi:hypothetical protein